MKIPIELQNQMNEIKKNNPEAYTHLQPWREILEKLYHVDSKNFLGLFLRQFEENKTQGELLLNEYELSQPNIMAVLKNCHYVSVWSYAFNIVIQDHWNENNVRDFLKKHLPKFKKKDEFKALLITLESFGYKVEDLFKKY